MKLLHHDAIKRLAAHALANGGRRVSQMRIEWCAAGNCQEPITIEVEGRPPTEGRWVTVMHGTPHPFIVCMELRCRRCDPCRKARQVLWTYRAKSECQAAIRTWFGTITLRPEEQFRARSLARQRLARQGIDYDLLGYGEQFRLVHDEINRELTKYIKRIRKETEAPFKYLLVAEAHKSGNPHYHMLVHERSMLSPIGERTLRRQWKLGFTRWKLATEPQQATYLCKYLSKSAAARVRASQNYGKST